MADEAAGADSESPLRFLTEAAAAREATRLNLSHPPPGGFWIEQQLPDGEWTVEARRAEERTGFLNSLLDLVLFGRG